MEEKRKPDDIGPSMGAFEADLLGTLMQSHLRLIKLVRQAPLDEDGKIKVHERILPLMDELRSRITDAVSDPKGFDLKGRLEAIYSEAEKAIDELSGGKQPDESPDKTG